ncbi:MAG: hypothetical protein ABSA92_10250 [Candidatus Bathyarchaeia archaeon]|jgi:hypothetical protein
MFEEEMAYYNQHRQEFLSKYEWKYLLIKGSELLGTFSDAQQAYAEGSRRFGKVPFLVKQVLREEQVTGPSMT